MISRSTSPRLAFLDAMRGIAVLMVFVGHAIDSVQPTFRTFQLEHFQLGRAGVFLFFLCSGFVIPISIERHSSLHRFWIGRFFRLYPLYWVCIAGVLALGMGETNERVAVLANLTMGAMWLGQPLLWPIFWSLCIELLFYIGMSICFTMGVLKHTLALTIGVIFLGGLIEALLALLGQPMTYEVFCNLATLLIGTIAYRVYQGALDRRQALLMTALAIVMFVGIGALTTPGMAPARLVALGIFGLGLYWRDRRFPWALIHQGRISYSIYLFHIFILALVPSTGLPALSILVWFVCVTVLATVTYHTIERPMIMLGQHFSGHGQLGLRWRVGASANDSPQEKTIP